MDDGVKKWIVVTGATGYVGTRLIPALLDAGHRVKAVSRSMEKLKSRDWASHPNVSLVAADASEPSSLKEALSDCSQAFYLVHSMNSQSRDFADRDRKAAVNFEQAAAEANVERIIYLGGLGDESAELSEHLKSRREVEKIFLAGQVPVTILRAAMIHRFGQRFL